MALPGEREWRFGVVGHIVLARLAGADLSGDGRHLASAVGTVALVLIVVVLASGFKRPKVRDMKDRERHWWER